MADLNQEVKINVDLEAETEGALAEIGAALTTIKSSANSLGGELEQIEDDVKSFGESFDKDKDVAIGGSVDIDSISDAALEAHLAANRMTPSKDEPDRQPTVAIGGEVDFDAEEIKEQMDREVGEFKEMPDVIDKAIDAKERFSESNARVKERTKASVTELKKEESAFDDIIDSGDTLSEIKQKVAGANQHVANMSKESADELLGEDTEARRLGESMGIVEESLDEAGDTTGAASRQIRKMRNSMDKTTDSMRAAAEVGDIFEDGLGSLSVNLGAFTVALRNFLTQVPLLLTALGAAGASAFGAASGFLALAGALGAVVAAGAVGHAQELTEQYGQLETLGDSLQVIMANLRDLFMEAAAPLLNSAASVDIFVQAVTGLARAVNVVSKAIAGVTEGTDQFAKRVEEGTAPLFTVQDAMDDISSKMGPAFRDLVGSLIVAFEVLGEEMIAGLAKGTEGLANMIDFSVFLFDQIEDVSGLISQFGDTLAELAILGSRIGGGLIPVFKAFSSIVQDVASTLNELESETMQDAITFLVMVAAINRVSGVAASLLTILPNLVVGMQRVAIATNGASGAMATMRAATAAAGTQLGGFLKQTSLLGGMTSLALALTGTEDRMRNVAFNTKLAGEAFEELAEETDFASDELRELAVQGMLTEEVLEDLDNTDVDLDVKGGKLDPQQFLPSGAITAAMFGGTAGAAEEAAEESAEAFTRLDPRGGMFNVVSEGSDEAASGLSRLKVAAKGVVGSFKSLGSSVLNSVKSFGLLLARIVAIVPAMIAATVQSLALGAAKLVETKSLKAATSAMWQNIKATNTGAIGYLKYVGAAIKGIAANFGLSGSALTATGSMYALATSIAVATGGIAILVGLIGALVVGIITNFDAIKSKAKDTFGFLKQVMSVVGDVVITYFITVWNLLVDVFKNLVQGISPLTDMLSDLGESLGIVGGDGASFMEMISSAGEILKGVIKGLGTVFGVLIDILGGVLTIATTLIRIALTPIIIVIQLIVEVLDVLISKFKEVFGLGGGDLVAGLKDGIDTFLDAVTQIPQVVENAVNSVIELFNGFLQNISNAVPGVNLGQMDTVDFTTESDLKTDKAELGAATKKMREGTAEKGDNTIMYNEDNSTNIDQTVNADPEDQAKLSRVVTDAIAEANSFERRRQGGQ